MQQKGAEPTEESAPLYKAQTSPVGRRPFCTKFSSKSTQEMNEQNERRQWVSTLQFLFVPCLLSVVQPPALLTELSAKPLWLTIPSPLGVSLQQSCLRAVTFYVSLKSLMWQHGANKRKSQVPEGIHRAAATQGGTTHQLLSDNCAASTFCVT